MIRKVEFNRMKRNVSEVEKCSVETAPRGLLVDMLPAFPLNISFQSFVSFLAWI